MACRPVFMPAPEGALGVKSVYINFKWHPGMAVSQKQKSVQEFHGEAMKLGYNNLLEISSKSTTNLGVSLSAFYLGIKTKRRMSFSVECAFQASKVFEKGGPYTDLLDCDSRTAKKDKRLKESGELIGFKFYNQKFSLTPVTFFYDWLYINALHQNKILCGEVLSYSGFTDIEFNPKKSINCQAHSAALYISLSKNKLLDIALTNSDTFLEVTEQYYSQKMKVSRAPLVKSHCYKSILSFFG